MIARRPCGPFRVTCGLHAAARCRIVVASAPIWIVSMSEQSPAELALAQLLVDSLNLEGVAAAEIDPEAPLFGAGLGLDSIDALELALAISRTHGFQLRSENDENQRIFASLRALSAHIEQHKAA